MTSLSLREAAEQAGVGKSTIWRAVKPGRISAARTDDGGFAIPDLWRSSLHGACGASSGHARDRIESFCRSCADPMKRDDCAQGFLDDAAPYNEMIQPGAPRLLAERVP